MLKLLKGIAYITLIVLLFPIPLLHFLARGGRGKPKTCRKRLRTGEMLVGMQTVECWPAMDATRGLLP